ncbi:nucleotidyltransferase family protein [Paenibacillus provencensis]|uniref:Nucleotidyltransferase family protein n=1 Tax=Paenibacillus provencensis TaxID=441151 RepID=A0ABW3PPW6_9BACL|nr:nucleotidyltransferase family protein [Paenibacillus sp. MER 78]MCM3127547.1 nucleotidyltransferase family protein [Paenibacillus sp. MER 78]
MMREEVKRILKEQKEFLNREYHVSKIGVFGSYARDEHSESSDIDILVEFTRPVGFEFIELKDYLETIFNKSVDLVTVKALKPYMKDEILSEVQFQ